MLPYKVGMVVAEFEGFLEVKCPNFRFFFVRFPTRHAFLLRNHIRNFCIQTFLELRNIDPRQENYYFLSRPELETTLISRCDKRLHGYSSQTH